MTVIFASVDALLESARRGLDRITPHAAHTRVLAGAIIVGGIHAWRAAGLPVAPGPPLSVTFVHGAERGHRA